MVTQRYQFESNSQRLFNRNLMRRRVFMVTQRYQFESNSQHVEVPCSIVLGCLWSHKDTNLKAIHNVTWRRLTGRRVFMVTQRYQFESNSQHEEIERFVKSGCLWSHKDTNLKAIHNRLLAAPHLHLGVYGHTKIPIWKQFTTRCGCSA